MLKKQYSKTRPVCKVTFYATPETNAQQVYLVGDFNGWQEDSLPMQPLKDGRFKLAIDLDTNQVYQFRYLVNGTDWQNDTEADDYYPNPFSGDNSVVRL